MSPELYLSISDVEHNVAAIVRRTQEQGTRWRPRLTGCIPAEIIEILLRHGCSDVQCPTDTDLRQFLGNCDSSQLTSVVLTELVTSEEQADQAVAHVPALRLLPMIDHFFHAELLSHAASRRGKMVDVLIDLNVGMNGTGIRPGYDAQRLAVAVRQLPGLKIDGITADTSFLDELDEKERPAAVESMISVTRRTRELLVREGMPCLTMHSRGSHFPLFADFPLVFTEVSCRAAYFGGGITVGDASSIGLVPALRLVTHVASRPSLPQAVLNGGFMHLGTTFRESTIDQNPGAVITAMHADQMVLSLACPALDLTIGDRVDVIPGCAELALRLNPVRLT